MKADAAFAAIDFGTSRIKMGLFNPAVPAGLEWVGESPNPLFYGRDGSVQCSFAAQWRATQMLLRKLGAILKSRGIKELHLGLCGHVSSLLPWETLRGQPLKDHFPIWLDSTCQKSTPALQKYWAQGRDVKQLGTHFPVAANWLAVKLHSFLQQPRARSLKYLQLHDAIGYCLSGRYLTQASAQISLVNLSTQTYAPDLLRFLGLEADQLPEIHTQGGVPMIECIRRGFNLPNQVVIYPGHQDTYSAFLGMFPEPGEGILLTGTSEVIGIYQSRVSPNLPPKMVRARLGDGWINYGSTNSGGNSVRWLMEKILQRPTADDLLALTKKAQAIAPGSDGLRCLSYFAGERAPLWNSQLRGTFNGLSTQHSDAHLLRALLEAVACARRQGFEQLFCPQPRYFKMAGGSVLNPLWNKIRAATLGVPLKIQVGTDLALVGALRQAMEQSGNKSATTMLKSKQLFRTLHPDPEWIPIYRTVYREFLSLQQTLLPPKK
jgi:sugar (pentulose or hexulose) kinase